MVTEKTYRILATLAISLGAACALLFGILSLTANGNYVPNIIYGVLLLLIAVGGAVLAILLNVKFKDRQTEFGVQFSMMPLFFIEGAYLISVDYQNLRSYPAGVVTFVFTILILLSGSIGMALLRKGNVVVGRVFILIFLGVDLIGTFMGFTAGGLVVLGNILRLGAIGLTVAVLFLTKGLSPLKMVNGQTVEYHADVPEERPVQESAPKPVKKQHANAPKSGKSLREELLEAKQLYEDGLISEEEYKLIKEKAINKQ